MTHEEFIEKWLGGKYRENAFYNYQCVALNKIYAKEVQNVTLGSFGGSAFNGWLNLAMTFEDGWNQTVNTIEAVPMQGDQIFFSKTEQNPYGHCAIVHEADEKNVTVIEQNAETGAGDGQGGNAIRIHTYENYKDVVGWFTRGDKFGGMWYHIDHLFNDYDDKTPATITDIKKLIDIYHANRHTPS